MQNDATPVLPDNLTADEKRLFEPSPDLATVETQLKAWVAGGAMKYELGIIYDGQVLKVVTRGKAALNLDSATAPITEADLAKANTNRAAIVLTHNHPGSAPLSRGDVALAVGRGVKAIRAVGRHGVFVFERKGDDWGTLDTAVIWSAFADGVKDWKAACPAFLAHDAGWKAGLRKDLDYRPKDGKSSQVGPTLSDDFFMSKHYACKRLVADNPGVVTYTYPSEQDLVTDRLSLYELRIRFGGDKNIGVGSDLGL